jgi:L-Lysine epsilon oxidase N-terminal/L-lysine epsilon oxidase C-terminal domain
MAKEYRIYPGIGIARLGNSTTSFFISPEIPGVGPLELSVDDSVQPVQQYKDDHHQLRRQGARFRIFEFDTDATGARTAREIVAGSATQIEWRVELANEKAAAGKFVDENTPEDVNHPRNPGIPQNDLTIKPVFAPISGANQTVTASPEGKFRGNDVYLGELRTDSQGRLIVLGGRGISGPSGLPIGDGSVARSGRPNTFANNEEWFDDIADGPVSATIRIQGQPDQVLTNSAWVIVAPPDFAPYTNGVTTLYDIATQAAGFPTPATPSFQNDVLPILKAAAGLRWVSSQPIFGAISTDYAQLSLKGDPNPSVQATADQARQDNLGFLFSLENNVLANFVFTANQRQVLNDWANGNFDSDYNANPAALPLTPDGLDKASLSQAVGGGFFPGIEAGIRMTSPQMYSSPFRITGAPFIFAGVPQNPHAGFITRTMACPWQSDFFECADQSSTSVWWPAQRPINVFVDPQAQTQKAWADSIPKHQDLVDKFWKLGLVLPLPGSHTEPLVEAERDPSVPHV